MDGEVWEGPGIPGLGRFEVVGRGGFSVVYRAWQEGLDRPVAVKVLLADLSDPGDARRFQRECAVLGRLGRHRHVVDVYEVGITRDRRPFIVMRFYPGGTLAGRLGRDGPVPAAEAVGMLVDLAGAVQAGHDQGVVHRDIKPDNVLIDEDGQVVLADFGISALVQEGVTRTGSAAFSEGYAAPEVLEENSYGVASDVYSLAATGYALLSGQAPFHETSGTRRLLAISSTPPAPITTAGVPAGLAAVVLAAMAKDPAGRPGSASEFAGRLQAALAEAGPDGAPVTAGPDAGRTRVGGRAGGFCRFCGAGLTGSGAFCPACGKVQDEDGSARTELRPAADATAVGDVPDPAPDPSSAARAGSRRLGVAGLAAALVLMLGVAAAVYVFGVRPARTSAGTSPAVSPTPNVTVARPAATVTATPKATRTITATPRTTTGQANLAESPEAAAALSEADALDELRTLRTRDGLPALDGLRGWWVPQVSSKCKGLTVDIQPDYFPDGRKETASVTTAEILAFHVSLADRFGAVTVLEEDFARPTPICGDLPKWIALVPQTFAGSGGATRWCIRQGFPWGECAARPIPTADGAPSKLYLPSRDTWYAMGGS